MRQTTSNRLMDSSTQKGLENEVKFLKALTFKTHRKLKPNWLQDVRPSSRFQDHCGIDALARTDRGDIPIQIKSSASGAKKFRQRYKGRRDILVVVIKDGDSFEDIVRKTLPLLQKKYEKIPSGIESALYSKKYRTPDPVSLARALEVLEAITK